MKKVSKKSVKTSGASLSRIATIVGLALLVPLFGNIFVGGWNWGIIDFVTAGVLLFAAGVATDYAWRKVSDPTYRIIAVAAIFASLLVVWAEMAVGALTQALALL